MAEDTEYITKEDLEQLLPYRLGPSVKVESFTVRPLTKPGENYGSNILAVDVVLKGKNEKLHIVVKLVPVSPFLRMLFQCGITVRKEMDMYLLVSPEYEKIQRENNIPDDELLEIFPVCYGARATKGEDVGQPADEESAIILENLKFSGYDTGDRIEGFDLDHTKFILGQLARFHATAIAIKLKKPEVFEKTVKKACKYMRVAPPPNEDGENRMLQGSIDRLNTIPGCEKYVDRVAQLMKEYDKSARNPKPPTPSEPFASISHNDFWTNNMLVSHEISSNKTVPNSLKIVDFQATTYDSPVKDLIFFLYTSTQVGLTENHYGEFISHYHQNFVGQLQKLGCDIEDFSFNKFLEELDKSAPAEFGHIFFMLTPLNLKKESATEHAKIDEKTFDEVSVSENYFPRVKLLLNDFAQRGWI